MDENTCTNVWWNVLHNLAGHPVEDNQRDLTLLDFFLRVAAHLSKDKPGGWATSSWTSFWLPIMDSGAPIATPVRLEYY